MRSLAILAIAGLAACKGKAADPAPPPPAPAPVVADAGPSSTDWAAGCEQVLRTLGKVSAPRRAQTLIDACTPCGDWSPLLAWSTPPEQGGPTRAAIEQAMAGCAGYCDANGKQRFLGTLDDARGVDTHTPWRMLGDACKDKVSSVPDARYMSAPYFALDRIARAVGGRPEGASLLAGVVVPLPPLSVSGVGPDLPDAPVVQPSDAPAQVTVLGVEYASRMPLATLAADGVHLPAASTYPGAVVGKDLAAALDPLGDPVLVLAPRDSSAERLPVVLRRAGSHVLFLGAKATGGPTGWQMYGAVPIRLIGPPTTPGLRFAMATPLDALIKAIKAMPTAQLRGATVTIVLGPRTTFGDVAKLLGVLSFYEVAAASFEGPREP